MKVIGQVLLSLALVMFIGSPMTGYSAEASSGAEAGSGSGSSGGAGAGAASKMEPLDAPSQRPARVQLAAARVR